MDDLDTLLNTTARGPRKEPDFSALAATARRRARRRTAGLVLASVIGLAVAVGVGVVLIEPDTVVVLGPSALDPAARSVSADVLPAFPLHRRIPGAVWTGTELVVWGGTSFGTQEGEGAGTYADGARYDPNTGAWQVLPAGPLQDDEAPQLLWTGSEVWVIGIRIDTSRDTTYRGQAAAYDPGTDSWRPLPEPPTGRTYPTAAWLGDRALVIGDDEGTPTAWTLAADGEAWVPFELPAAGRPDAGSGAVAFVEPDGGEGTALPLDALGDEHVTGIVSDATGRVVVPVQLAESDNRAPLVDVAALGAQIVLLRDDATQVLDADGTLAASHPAAPGPPGTGTLVPLDEETLVLVPRFGTDLVAFRVDGGWEPLATLPVELNAASVVAGGTSSLAVLSSPSILASRRAEAPDEGRTDLLVHVGPVDADAPEDDQLPVPTLPAEDPARTAAEALAQSIDASVERVQAGILQLDGVTARLTLDDGRTLVVSREELSGSSYADLAGDQATVQKSTVGDLEIALIEDMDGRTLAEVRRPDGVRVVATTPDDIPGPELRDLAVRVARVEVPARP